VVYLYDDKFDTICVAPGTKYESDLLPQTSTYRNTIANEVTLWETVELNGKKYDVTAIGAVAFAMLSNIRTITIPKTIRFIGDYAFASCSGVTDVYCYANPNKLTWTPTPPSTGYIDFMPGRVTRCHVIRGYLETYQNKFAGMNVVFVGDLLGEVEPEASVVSTFNGWQQEEIIGTVKIGSLLSQEGRRWKTVFEGPDGAGTDVAMETLTSPDGSIDMMRLGQAGTEMHITMSSAEFETSGTIKSIIVRGGDGLRFIKARVIDRTTGNVIKDVEKYLQALDGFYVVDFGDDPTEYESLTIELIMEGLGPIYLHSITIVQKEEPIASGGCGDNLQYTLEGLPFAARDWRSSGNIQAMKLVITGTGDMYDYSPWNYNNGKQETAPWEKYKENIVEAEISDNITHIGPAAFQNFRVTWQRLPSSLKSVSESAFYGCPFSNELRLPEGLTSIGTQSFFAISGIKDLYVPKSLTDIGEQALAGIRNLENFHVDAANPNYSDKGNSIINKNSHQLIAACKNTVIPDDVTSIGRCAFFGQSIESINLPKGLKTIMMQAFSHSKLKEVTIPDQVKTIHDMAFDHCTALLAVTIGSSVDSIGNCPFYYSTNILDVYCYADPDKLKWKEASATFEANSFKANKMTQMHVLEADLSKWQTKFGFLNVTFVGDLGSHIVPITEETTVTAEAVKSEDLTDNSVDNVYYNLDDTKGCGYDASQGCLVIGQTTDMSAIGSGEPGSSDVRDNFNGMIVKVGPGKGTIAVDLKSSGTLRLAVRIGNGTPTYAVRNERGKVFVSYNVAEETYVYIYAVSDGSLAPAFGRRTLAEGEDVLLIYGITVTPASSGNLPGDANGDGTVDVADVVAIVNKILEKPADNFNEQAADVNGDGVIDVSDVVGVVNIILKAQD
jgi:hypothetical protein